METDDRTINKYREWFRSAVDAQADWREAAKEDFEFVAGEQWTDAEKAKFVQSGRPAITLNRIKPLVNVLSGYQRLNRYDIDFLPRTGDDDQICAVRKGLTKYILDTSDYDSNESQVFLDCVIGGIGWFDVGYRQDDETGDGEACVKREDPFSVYPDPEAHKADFSDAKYICRAKWVDKDTLAGAYPEKKEDIEAVYSVYDSTEKYDMSKTTDPMFFKRDLQKARLIECWYKQREPLTQYVLQDGTTVPQGEMKMDYFLNGLVVDWRTIQVTKVRCCAFVDNVLLEDMESPYQHGGFPFVALVCYNFGVGDLPAGLVRDLKDVQREINKRRIQELHILNTASNGGGWIEEDAMSAEQKAAFERKGNVPGHFNEVRTGALREGKIQERGLAQVPSALIQQENQSTNDLVALSGINEAMMGTDVPNTASGRAIELRQKQAVTQVVPMFDALRKAKKRIISLLWGRRGHKGIIPQFYTADKVYRIEGTNGQQFVRVNQQVIEQDPLGNTIVHTLNDLSQGDFDIVIDDTQASATQRQSQMLMLIDAISRLGVPGELVFDTIIDLSDLPNKEEIKQRWQQRQEAQGQATQTEFKQKLQLEEIKNQNQHQSISFKDAPLPIQLAMAAKQGLIDPQIAQYAINQSVMQTMPDLARSMAAQQQAQMAQAQQQAAMQQQGGMGQPPPPQAGGVDPNMYMAALGAQGQRPQQRPARQLTQAAVQSLMAGQAPAMGA